MTHERQYRATRAAVIFDFTTQAIRNSRHTDASFAAEVAERYMDLVAPHERTTQFHVGTDAESLVKAGQRNAKLVERFRDGTTKLPADLEEAWVEALPEPYRMDCMRALARRYGFIGARVPEDSTAAQMLCTGRVAVEFGQAMQAMAELIALNPEDPSNLPRVERALKEFEDLVGEAVSVKATLREKLDSARPVPAVRVINR
ncbi:hypothetical protein V3391_06660 [Luteimonas sp. SMYT11W]|uniref:Uncharacterized protein n=1 Tax=Luteimonas flava TaxID=3115822 RepID=A0ABU7WEG9_9GAMM